MNSKTSVGTAIGRIIALFLAFLALLAFIGWTDFGLIPKVFRATMAWIESDPEGYTIWVGKAAWIIGVPCAVAIILISAGCLALCQRLWGKS